GWSEGGGGVRGRPAGVEATRVTRQVWPWRVQTSAPVAASQTCTSHPVYCFLRLSHTPPALARRVPSGLKATLWTAPVWPRRAWTQAPLAVSQTRTVLSAEALARRRPSGLKATLWTQSVWPWRARTSSPLAASQTRTVLSAEALARRLPSGLKATLETTLVWPWKTSRSRWLRRHR